MSDSNSLTLKDIAHRLHIGESTLNVWRNRYREWMPEALEHAPGMYPASVLDVFRLISKCTQAGFENQEIERILQSMQGNPSETAHEKIKTQSNNATSVEKTENIDDGLKDVLVSLKDLMSGMVSQQARIAEAQERRAAAQERMAFAMESQAENELVKTGVMRELVTVIQDMSVKGSVNSLMEHVKNMPCPSPAELEDFSHDLGFDMDNLEELSEFGEDKPSDVIIPDFDETSGAFLDENDDIPELQLEETYPDQVEMDTIPGDLDDLSLLLEPSDAVATEEMDDLSALLEPEDTQITLEMDDLSALLEPGDTQVVQEMDDLSLLLEESDSTPQDMDDLSQLIDDEPEPVQATKPPEQEKQPAPAAPPGDENYKSMILKRIIQMKKKDKLSVEEVVQRFNAEGVKTLSGKDLWDIRTIQGIYKYIDSFS